MATAALFSLLDDRLLLLPFSSKMVSVVASIGLTHDSSWVEAARPTDLNARIAFTLFPSSTTTDVWAYLQRQRIVVLIQYIDPYIYGYFRKERGLLWSASVCHKGRLLLVAAFLFIPPCQRNNKNIHEPYRLVFEEKQNQTHAYLFTQTLSHTVHIGCGMWEEG